MIYMLKFKISESMWLCKTIMYKRTYRFNANIHIEMECMHFKMHHTYMNKFMHIRIACFWIPKLNKYCTYICIYIFISLNIIQSVLYNSTFVRNSNKNFFYRIYLNNRQFKNIIDISVLESLSL